MVASGLFSSYIRCARREYFPSIDNGEKNGYNNKKWHDLGQDFVNGEICRDARNLL